MANMKIKDNKNVLVNNNLITNSSFNFKDSKIFININNKWKEFWILWIISNYSTIKRKPDISNLSSYKLRLKNYKIPYLD